MHKTLENVLVVMTQGPLDAAPARPNDGITGAWIVFEGIVRMQEDGLDLCALQYTAYEPMAQRVLTEIAADVLERHGLQRIVVEHARGEAPVGSCSFRLSIASAHRKAAIQAMDQFIDRMKQSVPIWKEPVWAAAPA
ncbi:MAG: molybdenum cofactor biosynthesis protein MoaE [Phycisphaerales bacterium]|nr:molybdenum cofactor biosynthesis protein MoaE [Phycisphaerales bacterium]